MSSACRWVSSYSVSICANLLALALVALTAMSVPASKEFVAIPVTFYTLNPRPEARPEPPAPAIVRPERVKVTPVEPEPTPPVKKVATPKLGLNKSARPKPDPAQAPVVAQLAPAPDPEPLPETNIPVALPEPKKFVAAMKLTELPRFVRHISPVYPEAERLKGKESRVLTEVLLDEKGNVYSVTIIKSGGERFDKEVIKAVRESIFTPGYINGEAAPARIQIPFRFKLN